MKRTELKRKTPLRRAKRLNPISAKRKEQNKEAGAFRDAVLKKDKYVCRLCVAARQGLFHTDKPHPELHYQMKKIEVHHLKGRAGELLHDVDNAYCLCTWHHLYSKFSPHGGPAEFKKLWEKINDQKET